MCIINVCKDLCLSQVPLGECTARRICMREGMSLCAAIDRQEIILYIRFASYFSCFQAICITAFVFSSIFFSSLAIAFARPWNGKWKISTILHAQLKSNTVDLEVQGLFFRFPVHPFELDFSQYSVCGMAKVLVVNTNILFHVSFS